MILKLKKDILEGLNLSQGNKTKPEKAFVFNNAKRPPRLAFVHIRQIMSTRSPAFSDKKFF